MIVTENRLENWVFNSFNVILFIKSRKFLFKLLKSLFKLTKLELYSNIYILNNLKFFFLFISYLIINPKSFSSLVKSFFILFLSNCSTKTCSRLIEAVLVLTSFNFVSIFILKPAALPL
jgi:hypothetical protein